MSGKFDKKQNESQEMKASTLYGGFTFSREDNDMKNHKMLAQRNSAIVLQKQYDKRTSKLKPKFDYRKPISLKKNDLRFSNTVRNSISLF